jgi:hypothetical protein
MWEDGKEPAANIWQDTLSRCVSTGLARVWFRRPRHRLCALYLLCARPRAFSC